MSHQITHHYIENSQNIQARVQILVSSFDPKSVPPTEPRPRASCRSAIEESVADRSVFVPVRRRLLLFGKFCIGKTIVGASGSSAFVARLRTIK